MTRDFEFFKKQDMTHGRLNTPSGDCISGLWILGHDANRLLNERGSRWIWPNHVWDYEALVISPRPMERAEECDHKVPAGDIFDMDLAPFLELIVNRECPKCGKDLT